MRFEFRNTGGGEGEGRRPPHHLADVEIVRDETPFAGLRIVGGAVWARKDGVPGILVALPARPGDSGYFQYFQNSPGCRAVQDLKDAILKAFAEAYPELAASAGLGEAAGTKAR